MYGVTKSRKFRRSLKRVSQYKDFDRAELDHLIELLRLNKSLEPHYRDHYLKGEFVGIKECHLRGDLVLLYKKEKDLLILLLVNIGTHASVFGE